MSNPIQQKFDDLTTADLTEDDIYMVELEVGMGRAAWDTIEPAELILACAKVVLERKLLDDE